MPDPNPPHRRPPSPSRFFVAPEFLSTSSDITYKIEYNEAFDYDTTEQTSTVNQSGFGLSMGWLYWEDRNEDSAPIGYMFRVGITGYGNSDSGVAGKTSFYATWGISSGWLQ